MTLYRTGIGQSSHRFLPSDASKPCVIAGLIFDEVPGFNANSDGDVVYHALCNAITSLTGVIILGKIADELRLKEGFTDSETYLKKAIESLKRQKVIHIALSLEAMKPRFLEHNQTMRQNIAKLFNLDITQIGLTATSGENLTDVGCGDGVACIAIITTAEQTSQDTSS